MFKLVITGITIMQEIMIGIVKDSWVYTYKGNQKGLQRYTPYDRMKLNLNGGKNLF